MIIGTAPDFVHGVRTGIAAQVGPYDGVVDIIRFGVAALALLLLALSLSAYRRTRLKALLYAATAFGLFAAQVVFEFLEDVVGGPFGPPYAELIGTGITFAILLLFFLAILKGKESASEPSTPIEPPETP